MSARPWSEKVVVVTGATQGIGTVTARELARLGARVIVVGRDKARIDATVVQIKQDTGNSKVEGALCDFASQKSIRALAADLHARLDRLDVLVNNAGAIFMQRATTEDGIEQTFAVNHLGYFLLTNLLLPLLKQSAPARVVSVSSAAHKGMSLNFNDLQAEQGYSGFPVYGRSKLCNVLFTRELARRLAGTGVTANCLHPGVIASGFGRNNEGFMGFLVRLGAPFLSSTDTGAQTTIHVATAPELESITGQYFSSKKVATPSKQAQNDADAKRLWDVSEKLCGLA